MGNSIGSKPGENDAPPRTPNSQPSEIEKRLHFIWLGSAIEKKELGYVKAWTSSNSDVPSDISVESHNYDSTIWVDPNALMVNETKREITLWAQWQAMTAAGIDSVEALNAYMEKPGATKEFSTSVARFATDARLDLVTQLQGERDFLLHDQVRIDFIVALHGQRSGTADGYRKKLDTSYGADLQNVQKGIQDGLYRDIAVALAGDQNAIMRRAYLQELNLRQNMAAASDIARAVVLKQEGGVYVDVDVLPRFKKSYLDKLIARLEEGGYVMPDGWHSAQIDSVTSLEIPVPGKLMTAITDAIVRAMDLVPDYESTGMYRIDSNIASLDRYGANRRQREILDEAVWKIVADEAPWQYSVFEPIGKVTGRDGYRQAVNRSYDKENQRFKVGVPNAVLLSSKDGEVIRAIYDAIKKNYEFILDEEVQKTLVAFCQGKNTGRAEDESAGAADELRRASEELGRLWAVKFGERHSSRRFFDDIVRYFQDGFVVEAKSTLWLSGPHVYAQILKEGVSLSVEDIPDAIYRTFSIDIANFYTSDQIDSSWLAASDMIDRLRENHFPDSRRNEDVLADPNVGPHANAWAAPELPVADASDTIESSSRYQRQLIIQLDGDSVSLNAAQRLYAKHPGISRYAQWRPDGFLLFNEDGVASETVLHAGADSFFSGDDDLRITFVGHGRTIDGETRFAGDTAATLLTRVQALIALGGYTGKQKLVLNLVACRLDESGNASNETFASQVIAGLKALLEQAGIARERVELHTRYGEIAVDEAGGKTKSGVTYRFEDGDYVRYSSNELAGDISIEHRLHHLAIGTLDPERTSGYADFWKMANGSSTAAAGNQYTRNVWVDPGALLVDAVGREIDLWAEYEVLDGMSREAFEGAYLEKRGVIAFEEAVSRAGLAKRLALNARLKGIEGGATDQSCSETDKVRLTFLNELRRERKARGDAGVAPQMTPGELQDRVREVWAGIERGRYRNFDALLQRYADRALVDGYRQELNLRQNLNAVDNIARALIFKFEGGVLVGRNLLPQFDGGFLKALLIELQENGLVVDADLAELLAGHGGVDAAAIPRDLYDFITDQVIIEQGMIQHKLLKTYPLRPAPQLALHDDAPERNLRKMFRSAIEKVTGKQAGGAEPIIFQQLGDLSNEPGLNIGRTNLGSAEDRQRGDGGLNDQLVAFGKGSEAAGRLYARMLAVYKLLDNPEIKAMLEMSAASESTTRVEGPSAYAAASELELALYEQVSLVWSDCSDEPLDDMLVADLLDYMSESRADARGTGSYINGQQHMSAVVERYIADAAKHGVPPEQALESLLAGEFNDRSADAAFARRLVRDAWVSALQKRLPQVAMLWAPPDLPSGLAAQDPDVVSEENSAQSFNYERQVIIQIDGDDAVRRAAQRLYGKHPDKSTYFQWVEGQDLKPFFNDLGPPSGYTAQDGLRALLDGNGSMRVTFVGHGAVQGGKSNYANRSAARFLQGLRSLFDQGLRSSGNNHDRWIRNRLVINLVGCELDDFASEAGASFAGEVASGLPEILNEFGVPLGDLELHARQGTMSVNKSGKKSNITIKYKFGADNVGGKTGRYVREMPLVPPLKDRERDGDELDDEVTLVSAPEKGDGAGGTERVDTWLDRFAKLGLREKPIGTAFELPEHSHEHNVVVALGPVASNQERAAAIFNNDPLHSTFIAIDGTAPERAVYLDRESGTLVVREGWSNLVGLNGRKTIRVVGAGAGSVDAPTFQNHSPAELADLIEPVLRRVTVGSRYGQSAGVTIALIRNDGAQSHQFSDLRYVQALSDALLPKLGPCGLWLGDVVFAVNGGHAAYTQSGEPGFMTSEGDILTGALGEVYQQLHEIRLRHDGTENGSFQLERFSFSELRDFGQTLESLRVQGNLDEVGRIHLGAAIRKVAALFHENFSALQRQAPHRDEREKMLVELQEVNKLREDRNNAIASLTPPEGGGWLLVPEKVEAVAGGKRFRVAYVRTDERGAFDPEDTHVQWRETDDDVFMRWADKARALGEKLSRGVSRAGATGAGAVKYFFSGDTEGGAAHTLTAAFMLQSLIGTQYAVFKGTEEQAIEAMIGAPISKLSKKELAALKTKLASLRNQAIVNYAQLTAGLIAEAGEMVKLVNILRGAETTVNLLAKVGAVSSLLSIAFDIANLVFASIDLAHATTPQEKLDAGLRVGIASVGAAVNVGAISAGAVAAIQGAVATSAAEVGAVATQASALAAAGTAATVGAVLGATGVLVAGLGVGAYAVYGAYQGVYNKQVAYLDELESAAIAVRSNAIDVEQGVLRFSDRLALESLDLRTGRYSYGDVRFRAFVTHAFAVPDPGSSMEKEWLSMYEPYIHYPGAGSADATTFKDVAVVLPTGLNRDYAWSLADDPGLLGVDRDASYPALSDLAARYPDKFFYIYRALYIVSYGPGDLHVEYKNTPFSLTLDEAARSVVIPSIEQDAYRRYLSYTLVGGGGEYSLVLPRWPIALDIEISASAKERWSFDLSTQAYAQGRPGDTLADSEMLENVVKNINVGPTGLTINGSKWATFSHGVPQHITFSIRLNGGEGNNGDSVILAFDRDVQTGKDRYVLSVPHVFRLEADAISNIRRLLLASGISERYLMVADNDGGAGLLDLESNVIYASWAANGTVTYDVNGKRQFLVAGDKPLDFATFVNQGKTERVVMWHIDAGTRADLSYVDDQVQSAIVRTSPGSLQNLMAQSDHSTFNFLGEWLEQVPSGRTVFFVDGEGGIAAGIRDQNANRPFMLTQYSNQKDAVKISLDKRQDRAMISASGVDSFGSRDLVQYATLLSSVGVIELVLTGIMDRRMHIDFDLSDPMFRGKRIVLLSDKSVDLALGSGSVSWAGDGPDVLFRSHNNTVVHWLGADAKGSESHTIDIDGSAQPLDVALERLPTTGGAMATVRTLKMSVTQQLPKIVPDHVMPDNPVLASPRRQWLESASRLSQSINAVSGDAIALLAIQTSDRPGPGSVLATRV